MVKPRNSQDIYIIYNMENQFYIIQVPPVKRVINGGRFRLEVILVVYDAFYFVI